jgi:hypothetical protein
VSLIVVSRLKQLILVRRPQRDSATPVVVDLGTKSAIFAGKIMIVAIDYKLSDCVKGFYFSIFFEFLAAVERHGCQR